MTRRRLHLAFALVIAALLWLPLGAVLGQRFGQAPSADRGVVTAAALEATAGLGKAEVLVVLRDQVDLTAVRAGPSRPGQGHRLHEELRRTADVSQAPLRAWLDARGVAYRRFYIVNALLLEADRSLLLALASRSDVAQIMTNPRVAVALPGPEPAHADLVPAPAAVGAIPWGISRIRAPQVWDLGYLGEGVVVAGQDTGYDWDHPALKAQYRGWDGLAADHDYNWHDAIHAGGGICGPDAAAPCDDNGHGTHTMGTIVGDDGAGKQIGVAPAARWIGCRNMSQGVGTPATYAECFEFFLAPYPVGGDPAQGDPARAPDVINNSWSCPPSEGCDAANIAFLEQVVATVRAAGILVVSSAGNAGSSCGTVARPPGMYDASLTIGATSSDPADTIAAFSSRGTGTSLIKPDLSAPGVSVESALPGTGYGYKSGTSMAAPHVAGAAALLWSAVPQLRGQVTTTEILLATAAVMRTSSQCGDAAGAVPNNVYGWGRLDALASLQRGLAETALLAGTVRTAEGIGLADATIMVSADTLRTWTAGSDPSGAYALGLLSGTYTVTASHAGYHPAVIADVLVPPAITTTLDLTVTPTSSAPMTATIYLPMVVSGLAR